MENILAQLGAQNDSSIGSLLSENLPKVSVFLGWNAYFSVVTF